MVRMYVDLQRRWRLDEACRKHGAGFERGKSDSDESGIRTHAPKDQMMLEASVLHRNCADLSLAP